MSKFPCKVAVVAFKSIGRSQSLRLHLNLDYSGCILKASRRSSALEQTQYGSTEGGFRMTSETHVLQLPVESTAGQESRFTSLHYFLLSHRRVIKRPFFFFIPHSNKHVFHKRAQLVKTLQPHYPTLFLAADC